MSLSTKNFGLIKPELTDAADITAFNSNWDIIDEELASVDKPVIATSADGVDYTATIEGVSELYVGLIITIIPDIVSASVTPTLDVNGLGALNIRQPLGINTTAVTNPNSTTWLSADKPVQLQYDGTQWKTINLVRTSASNLYGVVPVSNGGTGANNAEDALTNLGAAPSNHTHKYAGSSSAGGAATSATQLATARTIKTNLGSTSAASFNGTANVTPGVSGTLPIGNGGTGATTADAALTNLGAAKASHTHAAADLPVIPITKGGTGASTAEKALENLGAAPASHKHNASDINAGVLDITRIPLEELVNLYVWKKYNGEPEGYSEVEKTEFSMTTKYKPWSSSSLTSNSFYYDSTFTFESGKFELSDNRECIIAPTASEAEVFLGKYIAEGAMGNLSKLYYVPSDATIEDYSLSDGGAGIRFSKVIEMAQTGFVGLSAAKDNDSFPENGKHTDGYWYIYHKQLGE